MANLQKVYREKVVPEVQKELGIKNPMAVPQLSKIVVNIGLKDALTDKKVLDVVSRQLAQITGQRPITTLAKKSISAFKLRLKDKIGLKVTLRGRRMDDFFEKLTKVVLPRVRDFQGVLRTSFDGHGNYSLGFKEQIVFPEIDLAEIDKIRGLEVTIVTTAKSDKEASILLEKLGMPFKKTQNSKLKTQN